MQEFRHGTRYGYERANCRCELCRGWNATNAREYRKRRMARTGEFMLHGRFYRKVKDGNDTS